MVAQSTGTQQASTDTEEYILRSYRYLRLAIVVLLVGLAAAVIRQWWGPKCIEGSVSAYYYTPVHGLFIGSLVATGAAMVALKGRTTVEDAMFNVAGLLAPVVALVPTTRQDRLCNEAAALNLQRNELVPNSLTALAVAGLFILVVTVFVAKGHNTLGANAKSIWNSVRTGVVPIVVLAAGAGVARYVFDTPGYTVLHFGAAIGLFAAIFLAIGSLISEGVHTFLHVALTWNSPTDEYRKPAPKYYRRYCEVLIATVTVAVAVVTASDRTRLFWVEVVGICSFTVFWIVQTAELWDRLPQPTPAPQAGAAPPSPTGPGPVPATVPNPAPTTPPASAPPGS